MTYDDAAEDMLKFAEYLRANGKRPIAMAMHITDDHTNTDMVIQWGNREQLDEMCIASLASKGFFNVTVRNMGDKR